MHFANLPAKLHAVSHELNGLVVLSDGRVQVNAARVKELGAHIRELVVQSQMKDTADLEELTNVVHAAAAVESTASSIQGTYTEIVAPLQPTRVTGLNRASWQ